MSHGCPSSTSCSVKTIFGDITRCCTVCSPWRRLHEETHDTICASLRFLMSAMAARGALSSLHPRYLHLRALRTQAWPQGDDAPPRKFLPWTEPGIRRFPEADLDAVATAQRELRRIVEVCELLAQRPGWLLDAAELAVRNPSLLAAAEAHPHIFQVLRFGDGDGRLIALTAAAESLRRQEEDAHRVPAMEARALRVLSKLLMLSVERRLPLRTVERFAQDLGLPRGFERDLLGRCPEFFALSTAGRDSAPWVRLVTWDPELAVSDAEVEHKRRRPGMMTEMEMWTPKGYILSKRHRKLLARFCEAPFVSPYADSCDLDSLKMRFERHAVAGLRELLSLTLSKSLALDALAVPGAAEFSFSHKPLSLALRHPELFYVSPVGRQETVFLRAAYDRGELVVQNVLASVQQQFAKLLERRAPQR